MPIALPLPVSRYFGFLYGRHRNPRALPSFDAHVADESISPCERAQLPRRHVPNVFEAMNGAGQIFEDRDDPLGNAFARRRSAHLGFDGCLPTGFTYGTKSVDRALCEPPAVESDVPLDAIIMSGVTIQPVVGTIIAVDDDNPLRPWNCWTRSQIRLRYRFPNMRNLRGAFGADARQFPSF